MPATNFNNSTDFKGQRFYIGLDVHKKSWAVTIRSMGIEVARFVQRPSVSDLNAYLTKNFPGGQYLSAYEAGFCGTTTHELLCKQGISNIVIHAADIPATDKQKKNKTDVHDSRFLAERLEKGDLRGIHVLTREQQELRSLFRLREAKVKDVTQANNRLKSFLMFFNIELPDHIGRKEHLSIKALQWLNDLELASSAGTIALKQYLEELKYQRKQLYQITKMLREQIQAAYGRVFECLLSVPGIGSITAMGLIAEIGDFSRFKDPDQYASYLGLCPWEHSSGDNRQTKGIQPRCNRHLRPLLVEASWTAIKRCPPLFAYYSKHAVRSPKGAIIKVARRLAMIAKGVATSKQRFDLEIMQNMKQKNTTKDHDDKRFSSGIAQQHKKKQPGNSELLPG
ncbi:MAG: IS110 family transposase [Chitinophagaceae bacterium]|nr:IS110 family transposase [Chitinophagaceae bacterium]